MTSTDLNKSAVIFKNFHTPGKPLILANVYNAITAEAVASLDSCRAIVTL